MPELPEVQTVRRFLAEVLLRPKPKIIKNIKAFYPNMIKDPAPNQFINRLIGQKFTDIDRYGKFLILKLQKYSIISHLRMEGKYFLKEKNFVKDKHDHMQFLLTDGTSLVYNDVRKFGTMHLVKYGEEYQHPSIKKLGPEVNDEQTFTFEYLRDVCRKESKLIKQLLLDQDKVCGLGNIYVDETLFESRIHPLRLCKKLKQSQIEALCVNSKKIIDRAIEGKGTTIRSFSSNDHSGQFQNQLKVYGKVGQKCQICSTKIHKIKVGGRGTSYCPQCQV